MNNNVSWLEKDIKDFGIIKTRKESGELAENADAVRTYLTGTMERDNKNFDEVDKGLKDIVKNVLYENPVDIDELPNKIFEAMQEINLADKDKVKLSLNYIFYSILERSEHRLSIKDSINLCCRLAKKIAEGREYKPEDIFSELGESTKFAFDQFPKEHYPINPLQIYDDMVKQGFGQERDLRGQYVVSDDKDLISTERVEQEQSLNQRPETSHNSIFRRFINSLKSFFKSIGNFFAGIGNKLRNIFRKNRTYERLNDNENQSRDGASNIETQVETNDKNKFRQNIKAAPGISQVANGEIPNSITASGQVK